MDPLILIVLVVGLGGLLLLNWRTRKKQQEQLSLRARLEIGQQVQTIGGVIGTITAIEDDRITIESTPGAEIVFLKQALARLIEDDAAPETDEDDPDLDQDQPAGVETTTDQGEPTEQGRSAVVHSPEVPDETGTSVSPDSGDDETPSSTQN